jgi:hypothetical protein
MNRTESEIREHAAREPTTCKIDEVVAMLWSAIVAAAAAIASVTYAYFAFL